MAYVVGGIGVSEGARAAVLCLVLREAIRAARHRLEISGGFGADEFLRLGDDHGQFDKAGSRGPGVERLYRGGDACLG